MNLSTLKAERDLLNEDRNSHLEARSQHDKRARELAKSITHLEKQIILAYERGETDQPAQAQTTAATTQVAPPPVPKEETQSPPATPQPHGRAKPRNFNASNL